MKRANLGLISAMAVGVLSVPVTARDAQSVQFAAQEQMRNGEVMSLRQIEVRVVPRLADMEYLGFDDYDEVNQIYRLRFIDGNRVFFVYVNARNGKVIRVR